MVTTGKVQKPGYIPGDDDHANLAAVLEEAAAHPELGELQISMLRDAYAEGASRRGARQQDGIAPPGRRPGYRQPCRGQRPGRHPAAASR